MRSPLLMIGILQAFTILVGMLRAKGLSVLLGPAHFGVVSTIDQVVMTLVQLGALSLTFTAMKFISRSHSEGQHRVERTTASFVRAVGVLALLTTIAAFAALAWNPAVFGADLARYNLVIQIGLLGIPAVMLNVLFVSTLAATQRPAAASTLNLIVAFGLALTAIVGAAAYGLIGLYAATSAFGFLALIGSVAYLRRTVPFRLRGDRVSVVRELRESPEIFSYSAYIYVAKSAYALSLLAIRYLVLSRLGEAPAGFFQVSLSIALTVGAVLTTMNSLYLTPLVNRRTPVIEKVGIANEFAKMILSLLLISALPVVLFPRALLSVLYAPTFGAATTTVFLFVLWQCAYQVTGVYQQLLIGLDDVLFMAVGAVVGYGSAAALSAVLVTRAGLGGVAIALAAGMLVFAVLAAVRLRWRHRVGIAGAILYRSLVVVAVVGVAGRLFGTGDGEFSLPGAAARVGYGLASIGIFWLLLTTAERKTVLDAPASLRRILRTRTAIVAVGTEP